MASVSPNSSTSSPLVISYLTLRKAVGLLGTTLPLVLVFGSFIFDQTSKVQVSLSAYYHTAMRNGLVGIVCGISMFLLSYNGYDKKDSLISKLAGLFALGIAFFPTSATNDKTDIISRLHYISSGIFFLLLSYMSIFQFTKSAGTMTPEKKKRNVVYRVCGIIMVVSIALIPVATIPAVYNIISSLKPTLLLETFALIAFGFSWLTKGQFILKDE